MYKQAMHGTTKTDFLNVMYQLTKSTLSDDITGHVHKLETLYTMSAEMLHYVIIAIDNIND